jgi:poly-gamma-glutamate synthesis protein (capsule biosynthesis protein)
MYEIGAVAGVNVVKDKEGIHFENVHITPVVNHFEYGYTNFKLIPFSKYTEELASQHYQRYYSELFTIDYLKEQIHSVFDSSGFVSADLS